MGPTEGESSGRGGSCKGHEETEALGLESALGPWKNDCLQRLNRSHQVSEPFSTAHVRKARVQALTRMHVCTHVHHLGHIENTGICARRSGEG